MSPHRPPLLARAILRLLLPWSVHDAFAGDLEERFHRTASTDPGAARRAYWRDVLSPTVLRFRTEARGMPLPPGSSPGSAQGDGFVKSLLVDLKFATRMLTKAPSFTLIAIFSLALGIGPNTAVFSLVNAVLFQSWGVDDPDKIVDIYNLTDEGEYFFNRFGTYELIAEGTPDVFEAVAHHSMYTGRIGTGAESEVVLGEMVTGNYFDVMGVQAALGRTFLPEEDATLETHPVVVISDDFFQTRHGGDPSIVGDEIRLNGRPYTVVGVAPPEFRGRLTPGIGTDFWVPYSMYPHLNPGKPNSGDLTITGRLRDGVEPGQAIAAVETVGTRYDELLQRENPERRGTFRLAAVSLGDVLLHPNFDDILGAMAALLFVAVGLVLLVACVNLAAFLLSRAVDRRKEMAVRVAMGAGRRDIIRQLLVESLLLSGIGAALGLVLGQLAMRVILSVEPPIAIPIELEVGLSWRLLAFTAGAAAVAAVLFGLTPALEATRAPVASTLRDEAASSGGLKKVGVRRMLVAAQMTLSTVLLFGAILFIRSLQSATQMDLGFDTRTAAVVRAETGANEYTPEQRLAFVEEMEQRLATQPAIGSFGVTARMPLDLGTINVAFDLPGIEPPPNQNRHVLEMAPVTPGYFETMGIDISEGRNFTEADIEGAPDVAILSRAAADRYWPDGTAVGQTLYPYADGSNPITVIGVVDNVKIWSLSEPPRPYMYRPFKQGLAYGRFHFVATGNGSPGDLAALIRAEALDIDPEIFLTQVGTMEDHLGYVLFLPRMGAAMLTFIGILALLLACIGLYGMVSYGVSRRTREMGIRLALGADRQSVVRMVLKSGLVIVGIGALTGIVVSLGLGRLVEGFLLGVGAFDPLAILAAPLFLAMIAGLATYVPARKASRVDPVRALRSE